MFYRIVPQDVKKRGTSLIQRIELATSDLGDMGLSPAGGSLLKE